eukprot:Opistho-2@36369
MRPILDAPDGQTDGRDGRKGVCRYTGASRAQQQPTWGPSVGAGSARLRASGTLRSRHIPLAVSYYVRCLRCWLRSMRLPLGLRKSASKLNGTNATAVHGVAPHMALCVECSRPITCACN